VTPQATTASKEKTIAQFVLLPVMDDDVVIWFLTIKPMLNPTLDKRSQREYGGCPEICCFLSLSSCFCCCFYYFGCIGGEGQNWFVCHFFAIVVDAIVVICWRYLLP
jgi:hypothetical protein